MPDILSTIERTLAEAEDPSSRKKNKKSKKLKRKDKQNQSRNFDDLDSFKNFLKMESLDDYDEQVHASVNYYPPFVMNSCHNDPEKIKDSMNKNNNKFVRRLSQHVNRHLLQDIASNAEFGSEMDMQEADEEESFDKKVWHYVDRNEHVSGGGRKFKVEMDVECHNDNASVGLDFRAYPVV